MKGVLQTAVEFPDPLAARRRGTEGRIVEDNVHRRNVTVLSRIKAAIRANHILFAGIVRRIQPRPPGIGLRHIVNREIVGHTDIEFLSGRGQIFSPVEVVIRYHIATGDARHDLSLDRAVASGRTEARGLDRSVLCDQCRSAQILVRIARRIAPRKFRGSLPHLRDVVGISPSVTFRNARPIPRSAGTRCGVHLLGVGGRPLVRIRHHNVKRHTVSFYLSVYGIKRNRRLETVRILSQKVIAVRLKRRGHLAVINSHLPGKGHAVVRGFSA